jgi:DNA-directed RNA polymerase alpha subunit
VAQKAFHENRERLREERLRRETAAGPMLYPAPELPDDTLIGQVRISTRIRNALNAAGMKTIGEVRETSDDNLLSLPDLGPSSISYLRDTLGLPSTDGVRPTGKKPA